MISIITFINLFVLAFAQHQIARSWGSPAWHMEPSNPWGNQVVGVQDQGQGPSGHPMQWQDSQALNQWQEDAAASLPYSLHNHNGHSHYGQLFSQPQSQNSLGQPGFSPYGTPFHYVRTANAVPSPKYTTVLKHLTEAAADMTRHVSLDKEGKLTEAQIQYVMMLTAVNDLMDDIISMGPASYSSRYQTVVEDAMAKVEKNPLAAAASIRTRINTAKLQLADVIDLIKTKQSECADPTSPDCDSIIDKALDQSGNTKLQTEATFFVALAESMDLFSREYLQEVAQVANAHDAANFLKNAADHVKPLVLAGAEARKIGLQVKLLPLLRTNNHNRLYNRLENNRLDNNRLDNNRLDNNRLDNNRLDNNRLDNNRLDNNRLNNNRLDNALEYRRNRNQHNDH